MNKLSRRALAVWAADQLTTGLPAGSVAKQLAAVLVQSGMSEQAQFLINDVLWELEQRKELVIGRVTSAHKLSQPLESELLSEIKKATKAKHVTLEKNIDKSVLGGMRVETASRVWDHSVARKLSELREVR